MDASDKTVKDKKRHTLHNLLHKPFRGKSKKAAKATNKTLRSLNSLDECAPVLHEMIVYVAANGMYVPWVSERLSAHVALVRTRAWIQLLPHLPYLAPAHSRFNTHAGSTVEGILRISGSFPEINALKEKIKNGTPASSHACRTHNHTQTDTLSRVTRKLTCHTGGVYDLSQCDIHCVAGTLKSILRELEGKKVEVWECYCTLTCPTHFVFFSLLLFCIAFCSTQSHCCPGTCMTLFSRQTVPDLFFLPTLSLLFLLVRSLVPSLFSISSLWLWLFFRRNFFVVRVTRLRFYFLFFLIEIFFISPITWRRCIRGPGQARYGPLHLDWSPTDKCENSEWTSVTGTAGMYQ